MAASTASTSLTAPDPVAEVAAVIGGLTAVQKGLVLQFLAAADRKAFDAAVSLITARFPAG